MANMHYDWSKHVAGEPQSVKNVVIGAMTDSLRNHPERLKHLNEEKIREEKAKCSY